MEANVKKRMYMDIWLDHSAVQQKLTEHCKSTIIKFFLKKKEIRLSKEKKRDLARKKKKEFWIYIHEPMVVFFFFPSSNVFIRF